MTSLSTTALILGAMAALSAVEVVAPLHARGPWHRDHLAPNLALTLVTLATNAALNVGLVALLSGMGSGAFGPLHVLATVLALDFSFYLAHRAMHRYSPLWRFHAVHHADPAVDVTTTIRQHPVDALIRFAFLAVAAVAVGASPAAFAVYRAWSALAGLFEHANVKLPTKREAALTLIVTTPRLHAVHHSRRKRETNSNYGNVTSLFDRIFGTFISSERGVNIAYGLDGFDDAATQTTAALLAMPFRLRRDDCDADDADGGRAGVALGRPVPGRA